MGELEKLLLEKLRRSIGCKDIRQLTVIPRERDGDWICGCVQGGHVDQHVWRHAVATLETKYRHKYRLASRRSRPKYKIVQIGPNDYWRG